MDIDKIFKKFRDSWLSRYENMKIKEPDMRSILYDVDTLCHSIRREFERYDDEGIFEIDRVQKWLDKIEDQAFKIDDYEGEIAEWVNDAKLTHQR